MDGCGILSMHAIVSMPNMSVPVLSRILYEINMNIYVFLRPFSTARVISFHAGTAEEEKKATELRIACYLNIALCKLKKKEYTEAVRHLS